MSAQVDVLAVMDRDAAHADAYRIVYGVFDSTPQHLASESQKARAAVAALIAERDALLTALKCALPHVEHAYHTNPDPGGLFWIDVVGCRNAIARATRGAA